MEMKGQWIGKYKSQGGVDGRLIINIDKVGDYFEGTAFRYTDDETLNSVAYFSTSDINSEKEITADIFPVHPKNGRKISWEVIENQDYKSNSNLKKLIITFKRIDDELHLDATSDGDFNLTSILTRTSENNDSKIDGKEMSWCEFKSHISNLSDSQYLFRGQKEQQWKLRTSFHRGGRYQIHKFINEDVPQLHRRLSSITPHFFNLDCPVQNWAFWNLLQHHGYPTPLLDWTYSPYVAAFFAFQEWPKNYTDNEFARIYIFNSNAWKKDNQTFDNLFTFIPHFSVMDFTAIDNPRMVPQQAVTSLTNIDDIEAHIIERESDKSTRYLQAIDIPANQREKVMRDLRFMGITAGSMLPGIDGICKEMRERNFEE
jgi:hypothetical protein